MTVVSLNLFRKHQKEMTKTISFPSFSYWGPGGGKVEKAANPQVRKTVEKPKVSDADYRAMIPQKPKMDGWVWAIIARRLPIFDHFQSFFSHFLAGFFLGLFGCAWCPHLKWDSSACQVPPPSSWLTPEIIEKMPGKIFWTPHNWEFTRREVDPPHTWEKGGYLVCLFVLNIYFDGRKHTHVFCRVFRFCWNCVCMFFVLIFFPWWFCDYFLETLFSLKIFCIFYRNTTWSIEKLTPKRENKNTMFDFVDFWWWTK